MVRPTGTEMTVMREVVYFTTHSSVEAGGTAHHKGQDRETSRSVERQWELGEIMGKSLYCSSMGRNKQVKTIRLSTG